MLATFLYTLAGGMLAVLATAKPATIAPRFLRFACLLVLAVAVALVAQSSVVGSSERLVTTPGFLRLLLPAATLVAVLSVSGVNGPGRRFRWVCLLGGAAGIASACISALALSDAAKASGLSMVLVCAGQMFGALLLGTITIAWLLGHAYLTATAMTIAPLRHFSRLLSWAVISRAVFVLVSLAVAGLLQEHAGPSMFSQLANVWLIVSIRVGCGLMAVGVFAYMVADCVRLRATQSATGILYFASLLAYVGELAGQQLIVECGWPL